MSSANVFSIKNGILKKYFDLGFDGDVVIPDGVRSIGKGAFSACRSRISVVLPKGVKSIEEGAFSGCSNLTSISIPDGVTSIGKSAFYGCGSLISVTIPKGVTSIESRTFYGCTNLSSVLIPDGVKEVGSEAFANCKKLDGVIIPENVTEIQWGAFHGCRSLTSITVPKEVSKINELVFANCYKLSNITIQNEAVCFDDRAFDNCTGLADQDGFVIVNGILFDYCGHGGEITIPSIVTKIVGYAFDNKESLRSIIIPNSVRVIGDHAFKDCGHLEVVLPESLEKGRNAFPGCSCKVRVKHWTSLVTRLMTGCVLEEVIAEDYSGYPPAELLSRALKMSKESTWDPHAKNETAMLAALRKKAGTFFQSAIEDLDILSFLCDYELILPKDIDSFFEEAEKRGETEKKASLLDYQNRIGEGEITKERNKKEKGKESYENALSERISTRDPSTGIEGITFVITGDLSEMWESRLEVQNYLESYGAKLARSVTKKTDYLVSNETKDSEKFKKAEELGVQIITEREFNELVCKRFYDNYDKSHITIPAWVKTIPGMAFFRCQNLEGVTIPGNVISIGDNAFAGCDHLTDIKIPEGVTRIEEATFEGCRSLLSLLIPHGVTSIGDDAFSGCVSLKSVSIPESVTSIGAFAFYNCESLADISIPCGVTSIGLSTFGNCKRLKKMSIPNGVRSIDYDAFYGCCNLTDLMLPDTVETIAKDSFSKCPLLTIYAPSGSYAEHYAKENNISFVAE